MAKKYISCEINKVFEAKGGKFGLSLKPLEENHDIENSNSYKSQYNNFTINYFLNGEDTPNWAKEGNKIKFCYSVNNGWININQDDGVTLDDDISLEDIADDLDDSFDPSQFEKETETKPSDPVMNKINNMAELYANILKVVHNQEYLKDLDNGLQKDIATSFFIEYNKR